jgi:hypothetical protein
MNIVWSILNSSINEHARQPANHYFRRELSQQSNKGGELDLFADTFQLSTSTAMCMMPSTARGARRLLVALRQSSALLSRLYRARRGNLPPSNPRGSPHSKASHSPCSRAYIATLIRNRYHSRDVHLKVHRRTLAQKRKLCCTRRRWCMVWTCAFIPWEVVFHIEALKFAT